MGLLGRGGTATPGSKLPARLLPHWLRHQEPEGSKKDAELDFQKQWARFEWDDIIQKLRLYWETYRCFDEIMGLVSLKGKKVLDVGCGVVSVLNIVPAAGSRVRIDPLMLSYQELYRLDPGVKWLTGNAEILPFVARSFDTVFCTNVLDHVESPARALAEAARVLAPDGRFVFTVDVFPYGEQRDKAHPHAFTMDELHTLLGVDFEVLFERTSSSRAQVYNFINRTMQRTEAREVVGVAVAKV